MIIETNQFDHLIDDEPIQDPNDNQDLNQKVQDPVDDPNLDDPDNSNDDPDNSDDLDALSLFLKENGLKDGRMVTFEDDDGNSEEVDFFTLSKDEQLTILKEITNPGLTEDEINTINYLRKNNATIQDVIEYYKRQAVEEYITGNGPVAKAYSVDDYSDEELYLADLKEKYSDMSEEELKTELELAQSNAELFKKKVDTIRNQYKAQEDRQAEAEKEEQEQQYEAFKTSLHNTLGEFNTISLDYKDQESDTLVIEDEEKEKIFSYILNRDENGMPQFFKDLNDPNILIELAWYRLFGKDAISGISQYWKDQLKESRKVNKSSNQKPSVVISDKPDPNNSKDKVIDSYYEGLI